MRRMFWIAVLSSCAGCGAPPATTPDAPATTDPATIDQPSEGGASSDPTAPADPTDPTDPTDPADPADPSDDPAEAVPAGEPSSPEAPSAPDAPADSTTTSDAPAATNPAAATAPIVGIVAEKPASGPFVETDQGFMVPYTTQIPGTDVEFQMVPVPGGTFNMGSPDSEADRGEGEGPQFQVELPPFWMSRYETTWGEYKSFMMLVDIFINFTGNKMRMVNDDNRCDAVTAPSNLYDPSVTFAQGDDPEQPAVTMTAFAAKQYSKWLSLLTGQIYRLPTEAEWEYACRAGTTTAYSFGDDPADLGEYAWYTDNSDEKTHPVGQKKPNPWGLHDMHGNAAELVLDEYRAEAYAKLAGKTASAADAVAWPTEYDNRVFRGGSWDDFEEDCRSARRRATEGDNWKIEDPNEPKSPWWYSDEPSQCVGFRLVRPLAQPTKDELELVWGPAVEDVLEAASYRMSEGRGAWGLVDPDLPAAIDELKKKKAGG